MAIFFNFLAVHQYILLFFVIALAIMIGQAKIKSYSLGMTAGAIIIGCAISTSAAVYGVHMRIDDFTKDLFFYLFMYGVGLRVGPSFFSSFKAQGLKFAVLALVSCLTALAIVICGCQIMNLPFGSAGGILAGSQTISAAIGSAEQAAFAGIINLPGDVSEEDVSALIGASFGMTYIWGTAGIVLICKYLPRWWRVDVIAAAASYEKKHGVPAMEEPLLQAFSPLGLRSYRLENENTAGMTVRLFEHSYPEYQIVTIRRGDTVLEALAEVVLQKGDIIALGGTVQSLTDHKGLIGQEVVDERVLDIPLDQAVILVTNPKVLNKPLKDFRDIHINEKIQISRMERNGASFPVSLETRLQSGDLLFITGLKHSVDNFARSFGHIARASSSTDLLTFAVGMILGFLIGQIKLPMAGTEIGLGYAGGLLFSGLLVSYFSSRIRIFGNTPNAARNILEDLGLIVFISIVGINSGSMLLQNINITLAVSIVITGFMATTLPAFLVWIIGFYGFKINPAILVGGIAGAHCHSSACQETVKEINSNLPWIGFPVAYAVSSISLTVFAFVAMIVSS